MKRLGAGSWWADGFDLPDDVLFGPWKRLCRTRYGIVLREARPNDHIARIVDDMRAGADD